MDKIETAPSKLEYIRRKDSGIDDVTRTLVRMLCRIKAEHGCNHVCDQCRVKVKNFLKEEWYL